MIRRAIALSWLSLTGNGRSRLYCQVIPICNKVAGLVGGVATGIPRRTSRYQEARQMPFISRVELMAKHEGIQQGILQTLRESAIVILETRFEVVPPEVIEAINGIEDKFLIRRLYRLAIVVG